MNDTGGFFARLGPRKIVWLTIVVAFFTFVPSLADGFVYDDGPLFVRNPYAHDASYLGRCFTTDLWDTPQRPSAEGSTRFYRPLVCASYILNWKIGGGKAWSFHLVNVLLHAATSGLAARMALRLAGAPVPALLAALVFAVHPSRTENVEWISGRTDVLMALFLLGAHELAVRAARRGKLSDAILSSACFLAALLSKEFAVCWPFFLGAEIASRARSSDSGERRRLVIALVSSLGVAIAYLGFRAEWFPIRPPELDRMVLPLWLHTNYVLLSLGYYVQRIAFPWPQVFHFHPVATVGGAPVFETSSVVIGALAAAGFALWLARAARRDPALAALLIATLVVFLPILNVSYTGFPGTTTDRFLYLPLLPLAIAASKTVRLPLVRWAEGSRIAPLVVGSAGLVYVGIDWVRSVDYISDAAIWSRELEENPDDPQALGQLAEVAATAEDADEAIALLRRALSPAAQRFALLSSPTRAYIALLELEPRRVADGDVRTLAAVYDEIGAVRSGRPRGLHLPGLEVDAPSWDPHFRVQVENSAAHLEAAAAGIASRLGLDPSTRNLAASIQSDAPLDGPGRYNLALALGRARDFAGARAELAIGLRDDAAADFRRATASLASILAAQETAATGRAALGSTERALGRAHDFFELGAYLRAARALRSAHLASPTNPAVTNAYIEALAWARLDADADSVANAETDPKRALSYLESVRDQFSSHTRRLHAAPAGVRWWDGDTEGD